MHGNNKHNPVNNGQPLPEIQQYIGHTFTDKETAISETASQTNSSL